MSDIAIELKNISKTYSFLEKSSGTMKGRLLSLFTATKRREIQALKNINLEIKKGEFFGILGHNGCGKSTLLKIMSGAYPPDPGGTVKINGRFMLLTLGLGFNSQLTARENIYLNASILGLTLKQIGKIFHQIIEFAELENYVDTQIKYFSTGMVSRLKFAIAVQADADIFLMDEFFGGVGDVRFKKKSEKIFHESLIKGKTIVHVSHSLKTIRKHCTRVLLLHQGNPIAIDTPEVIIPQHEELMKDRKEKWRAKQKALGR